MPFIELTFYYETTFQLYTVFSLNYGIVLFCTAPYANQLPILQPTLTSLLYTSRRERTSAKNYNVLCVLLRTEYLYCITNA